MGTGDAVKNSSGEWVQLVQTQSGSVATVSGTVAVSAVGGITGDVSLSDTRVNKSATIANGQSLSGAVDVGDLCVVGIVMPATWTTAALSFQGSHDGTTYQELKDDTGTLLSYNPLQAGNCSVKLEHFLPWRYLKVRSGTAASAVAQDGERVVVLVTRPV